MAADAPLRVPRSAAALVLLDGLRVLSLCMALFLPELGGRFGQSAYALAFREFVDVPAQVVDLPPLYAYEVRVPGHPPRRVHARYTLGGVEGEAVGVIDEVPLDSRVTARVPLRRPDLAMAFVGEAPPGDSGVVRAAWLVGLLFGGWVLTLAGNLRLLRVLRRGRLLPALALQRHLDGADHRAHARRRRHRPPPHERGRRAGVAGRSGRGLGRRVGVRPA